MRAAIICLAMLSVAPTPLGQVRLYAAQDENQNAAGVQVINRANEFKAVFLFNFGHYVSWPDDDTATADNPFIIGVVGKHDATRHLQTIAGARKRKAGKRGVERKVIIKQFDSAKKVSPVHILFVVKGTPAEDVKLLIDALAGQPTLIVGEDDKFVDGGGMISLGVKNDKMHLSVSIPSMAKSQLKPSAKLLQLAPDVRK